MLNNILINDFKKPFFVILILAVFFISVPSVFAVAPPSVTSISPAIGPTAGGTSVTITGTGFAAGTITIGGTLATGFNVVSATQITATTPTGTAGAQNVVFTRTSDGKSGTLTEGFTYMAPLTLTYTAGAHGSITGTSLQTVNYGADGTAVTAVADTGYYFVNWSDTSTANPRTDTNVTANISVTANFASLSDSTAPAAVTNLATGAVTTSSIVVSWTAPGDDDSTGTATTYDLRYSTSAITSGNFDSATSVTGESTPSIAGSSESMTVSGLSPSTTYYFALKTSDEVSNESSLSNVVSGTTAVSTPEPTITVSSGGGGSVAPTSVRFSGQAYPGSKIEVLRKSSWDKIYQNIPLSDSAIDASGKFAVSYTAFLQGEYLFAVRAQDKEGRKSGILSFGVDLGSTNELVKEDLLLPPTISSSKPVYSKGENIVLSGYAASSKKVEVEIGNFPAINVFSGSDGKYSISTTTANLDIKDYLARARQVISESVASDYSTQITFRVSSLQFPLADFNGDNKINIADWSVFLFRWGSKDGTLRIKIDMNADGKIDVSDLSIFLKAMKI